MTPTDDMEAQFTRTLNAIVGQEIRSVRLKDDALELFFAGRPSDPRHLRVEIRAPWRIVEDGEIVTGSYDVVRAGMHRQRLVEVGKRCQGLVGRKGASFELLDFVLELEGGVSVEHFANSTGEEAYDYFVAIDDSAFTGAAFRLGSGWILPIDSAAQTKP